MTIDFSAILPYASLFVSLCIVLGGYFALRYGYGKAIPDIQEKVIVALNEQISSLDRSVKECKTDLRKMTIIFDTIQKTLRRRGINVEVWNSTIFITDTQKPVEQVIAIPIDEGTSDD